MPTEWNNIARGVLEFTLHAVNHAKFLNFLSLSPGAAMQEVSSAVRSYSPVQFEAYEANFLHQAASVVDHDLRIRAIELYAWLKVEQQISDGEVRFLSMDRY